ncbi:MAG: transcriptional regulator [Bacillota bacterium]
MTSPILQGCDVLPPMELTSRPRAGITEAKSKSASRFAVLNTFIDVTLRDLDRAEVAVWLVLYRDTKPNGIARTAQTDIARRSGLSERHVRRVIGRLIKRKLLALVHRGGIHSGPSTYRVIPLADLLPGRT